MKNICLFVLVTAFCSCNGQQNESFEPLRGTIVTETHDSILVTFQDKNKNYWFGSNGHGVYLYNGKKLIQFTTKHGLCSDQIWEIKEDKDANVYFTTPKGICKYDGRTFRKLIPIEPNSFNSGWGLNETDLWFKGPKGPYRYDGNNLFELHLPRHDMEEDLRKQFPNMSYSPYEIYSLYKDKKGNVWFGTGNLGVCRYDGINFSWLYEDQLQYVPAGGSFGIRSIIEDKDGKFWFCNTKYRYSISVADSVGKTMRYIRYRKEKGIDIPSDLKKEVVYFMSVFEDSTGSLWMATYQEGVWQYNKKIIMNFPLKNGDKNVTSFSIYNDNLGSIWLSTHTNGVYKFNGKEFEKFKF